MGLIVSEAYEFCDIFLDFAVVDDVLFLDFLLGLSFISKFGNWVLSVVDLFASSDPFFVVLTHPAFMGLVEIIVSKVGDTVRSADRDIFFSIDLFY